MSGSGAYVGRDILVRYSLDSSTTVIPTDFVRLGAVRNKEFGSEWDTVDTTADDSPNFTKENLATFQAFNTSLSGVSRGEEIRNQDALEDHVAVPPAESNNQPCGWIQIVRPSRGSTKTYTVPVLFNSFRITGPYDDAATWAMEALSNGLVTITYQ